MGTYKRYKRGIGSRHSRDISRDIGGHKVGVHMSVQKWCIGGGMGRAILGA